MMPPKETECLDSFIRIVIGVFACQEILQKIIYLFCKDLQLINAPYTQKYHEDCLKWAWTKCLS